MEPPSSLNARPSVASALMEKETPGLDPRRSGRARVSTTVQIDGHTILKQNNYSVNATNYLFQKEEDGSDAAPEPPKSKKPKIRKTTSSAPPQKRKPTPAQAARQTHNQAVLTATRSKQPLRQDFLARHVQRLEPFCEISIVDKLKQRNASLPDDMDTKKAASVSPPKMIQATLRDYQLRGLEFMVQMHRQNLAMILGDEMGLGKTLQTISLLAYLKEQEQLSGPSLVVCPLSVLSSWCNELQKWAPSLKYFRLHASDQQEQARQKQELADHATEYDVILTTYEMAKVPTLVHGLYQRVCFHYLVLDEGHKIKGHLTQLAAAVRKIRKGNTLLLTGTPLQNNLVELWSLLHFLFPEIFTTMDPFANNFDLRAQQQHVDKSFLLQTQKLLELFMLRRLKTEVEKLMPAKLETKVYCPLSKTQTFWYKALLMKDVGPLANMENGGAGNKSQHLILRSLFMQLRKCCNHPFLFEGAETDPDQTPLQELVASSGKLSVLDMLLQALSRKGHRAVLFSQFTMLLDLLEDYCILRGWKYCRLDGSTDRARRNYLIRRFNEPNSPYFLFLSSTRSGGQGLNLQSADTCILFDSDWNPQSDIQAMARVHRIGQTKTVHVYRLVSSGTIEERMLERAEKKLLLEMVNRESKDAAALDQEDMARGLSAAELLDDIKFGCQAIFGDSDHNKLPSWEDIENITDRSRKESDSAGKLKGGTSKNAKSFDAEQEFSATQFFGGADFRAIRNEQERKQKKETPKHLAGITHLWKEIQSLDQKRNRKSRIVLVDGTGSGYGSASVPVLASNNYELLNGESSVFDRELSQSSKSNFEVKKRKKAEGHDNQDHCQVCGDGGHLVCCPQCPCSVHLHCVGLKDAKQFWSCPHHRCSKCFKNRSSAGGLLFPCQSCSHSFCEDCLPEQGVTFLDRVDRFEKLGFDSTKNVVYIHCSTECENYAREVYGYISSQEQMVCKEPLELSYNFGASYDLTAAQEAVAAEKKNTLAQMTRTRFAGKSAKPSPRKSKGQGLPKLVHKLCPGTKVVLEQFNSMAAAVKSVNGTYSAMNWHIQKRPTELFHGFYWRVQSGTLESRSAVFNTAGRSVEKLCPKTMVVLEEFASMSGGARSVNSSYGLLWQHLHKKPNDLFKGFYWRFKAGSSAPTQRAKKRKSIYGGARKPTESAGCAKRLEKLCPQTLVVLEEFGSISKAAISLEPPSNNSLLSEHLKKTPNEPFRGYYWRFQARPSEPTPTTNNDMLLSSHAGGVRTGMTCSDSPSTSDTSNCSFSLQAAIALEEDSAEQEPLSPIGTQDDLGKLCAQVTTQKQHVSQLKNDQPISTNTKQLAQKSTSTRRATDIVVPKDARVNVWWAAENRHYPGIAVKQDADDGLVLVQYDDGDVDWEDPLHEKFEIIRAEPTNTKQHSIKARKR